MPSLVISCPVCAWKCTESLWTWYLTNCLQEFHQIYNFGTVGNKDELIRFRGQRSKVTVVYGQISTLGGIFSRIYRMHGHILTKLITCTHYQVQMTQLTFSRSLVKGQVKQWQPLKSCECKSSWATEGILNQNLHNYFPYHELVRFIKVMGSTVKVTENATESFWTRWLVNHWRDLNQNLQKIFHPLIDSSPSNAV